MISANLITENNFKILEECIKRKGTIISERMKSPTSNLYILKINGEIKRYINQFEAFNNLAIVYNCTKQIENFIQKENPKEETFFEVTSKKENISSEEKIIVHDIEMVLYKNKDFIRLSDLEKDEITTQIKLANVSRDGKIRIIKEVIILITNIFNQEKDLRTSYQKINFKRNFERITSFLQYLIKIFSN